MSGISVTVALIGNSFEELRIDLETMGRQWLFVAAPLLMLGLVSLNLWQSIEAVALQNAVNRGASDERGARFYGAKFSPDGRLIVSGNSLVHGWATIGGEIKLWDAHPGARSGLN